MYLYLIYLVFLLIDYYKKSIYTIFVNFQMSIDTMTPGGGRGRGCGRGAPFGNSEQRRELRNVSPLKNFLPV